MLFAFILKFKLKEKTIMRQSLIAVGMFLLTGGMVGCGTSSTQEREAPEPTLSENIIKLQITDNHILSTMQSKSKSF